MDLQLGGYNMEGGRARESRGEGLPAARLTPPVENEERKPSASARAESDESYFSCNQRIREPLASQAAGRLVNSRSRI